MAGACSLSVLLSGALYAWWVLRASIGSLRTIDACSARISRLARQAWKTSPLAVLAVGSRAWRSDRHQGAPRHQDEFAALLSARLVARGALQVSIGSLRTIDSCGARHPLLVRPWACCPPPKRERRGGEAA